MSPQKSRRPASEGGAVEEFAAANGQRHIVTHRSTSHRQAIVPPATWRQLTAAGYDVEDLQIGATVYCQPEPAPRRCCTDLLDRLTVVEHRLREARDLVEAR